MDSSSSYTIILLVLILLSGVFSATETAYSSVNEIKVKRLAKQGNKRAKRAYKHITNFSSLITTILIGNNLVNIASSSIMTYLFTTKFNEAGLVYATLLMTIIILIFGEIFPKIYAKNNSFGIVIFMATPLYYLKKLTSPLSYLTTKLEQKMNKNKKNVTATENEFLEIVQTIEQEGVINQDERTLIENSIRFDDLQVKNVMKHKDEVIFVHNTTRLSSIIELFVEHNYSRIPVIDKKTEQVIGLIHEADVFKMIANNEKLTTKKLIRDCVYVSSFRRLPLALSLLQKNKEHMAIVVDNLKNKKYLGLVTLEDMLEEIVGEIYDEYDDLPDNVIEIGLYSYEVFPNVKVKYFYQNYMEEKISDEIKNFTFEQWINTLKPTNKKANEYEYENITLKPIYNESDEMTRIDIEVNTKDEEEFI